MALIKCPNCKKKVSDSAKSCPHCGFEVRKKINEEKIKKSIDSSKKIMSSLMEKAKENKKKLIIGGACVLLLILVIVILNIINDKVYENNKSKYPNAAQIDIDSKESIVRELEKISLNEKTLNVDYDMNNIKDISVEESTDAGVYLKFVYHVEGEIIFDIPYVIYYRFDGHEYNFSYLEEDYGRDRYTNVEINDCEEVKDKTGKSIIEIVNEKYADKYDSITKKDTNKEEDVCKVTFEAKKDGSYITRNDTITATSSIYSSSYEREFEITTSTSVDENVDFNLVGKWHGDYEKTGFVHQDAKVDFEITKVDGVYLTYGETGWITAKDSWGTDHWKLMDSSGYVKESEYGYYTFTVGFKYGKDASGVDSKMTIRVYDDKLLFYCNYNSKSTAGCYELKKS